MRSLWSSHILIHDVTAWTGASNNSDLFVSARSVAHACCLTLSNISLVGLAIWTTSIICTVALVTLPFATCTVAKTTVTRPMQKWRFVLVGYMLNRCWHLTPEVHALQHLPVHSYKSPSCKEHGQASSEYVTLWKQAFFPVRYSHLCCHIISETPSELYALFFNILNGTRTKESKDTIVWI